MQTLQLRKGEGSTNDFHSCGPADRGTCMKELWLYSESAERREQCKILCLSLKVTLFILYTQKAL